MHIDPRRLPVLLAVHREGGVVAAADVLGISASAVSQQIQRLESEVGLALVERTPTGAVLTPAGHILARGAERIEAELTDVTKALRPLAGQVTGTVTIGAFFTVMRSILLPFIKELNQLLPGVEIHIVETEETPGQARLRSGSLDLLLLERDTPGGATPRGYEDTLLLDEPWMVVTPSDAPPVATMEDLGRLRWLRFNPEIVGDEILHHIASRVGKLTLVDFSFSTYEAAIAMVRSGFGSTVLPSMAVVERHIEGVRSTLVPGLGSRRILVRRRRATLPLEEDATGQVIKRLSRWVARNPHKWS